MYFGPPDAESNSASNESIFKPNGLYLSVLRWEYYPALSTCLFGRKKKKQSAPYVPHMAVTQSMPFSRRWGRCSRFKVEVVCEMMNYLDSADRKPVWSLRLCSAISYTTVHFWNSSHEIWRVRSNGRVHSVYGFRGPCYASLRRSLSAKAVYE